MDLKQRILCQVNIESMIKVDPRLASLSEVCFKFRSAVQAPNIDLEGVEQIILKDTELTVSLPKLSTVLFIPSHRKSKLFRRRLV
jgi:HD-like signal output (HDOD) protein